MLYEVITQLVNHGRQRREATTYTGSQKQSRLARQEIGIGRELCDYTNGKTTDQIGCERAVREHQRNFQTCQGRQVTQDRAKQAAETDINKGDYRVH